MSQTIKPAAVRKVLIVKAPPEKAFSVFTDGLHLWWPKTHSVGDAPLKRATIEPRVGGRWYSLTEDGVEHEWGDVLAWEPPARVVLAWRLNGAFAYDPGLLTEVEVRFTALADGQTQVDFQHRGLEHLGTDPAADQTRGMMDEGWGAILASFEAVADRLSSPCRTETGDDGRPHHHPRDSRAAPMCACRCWPARRRAFLGG